MALFQAFSLSCKLAKSPPLRSRARIFGRIATLTRLAPQKHLRWVALPLSVAMSTSLVSAAGGGGATDHQWAIDRLDWMQTEKVGLISAPGATKSTAQPAVGRSAHLQSCRHPLSPADLAGRVPGAVPMDGCPWPRAAALTLALHAAAALPRPGARVGGRRVRKAGRRALHAHRARVQDGQVS